MIEPTFDTPNGQDVHLSLLCGHYHRNQSLRRQGTGDWGSKADGCRAGRTHIARTDHDPGACTDPTRAAATPRLLLAVGVTAVAALAQHLLWPWLQPYTWFLFYPAVVMAGALAGRAGALSATALSVLLAALWFQLPDQGAGAVRAHRRRVRRRRHCLR